MNLSERLVGEIIGGRLYRQPHPAGRMPCGGPRGWWILDEPGLHFVRDNEIAVPDIAGWRREHLPRIPRDARFEVVPN
ncbi:MAG TPA: hypothetical protein VHJ19_07210 [Gammaproteobacteria bacterium]|jgi:hypothetical protein|nr:hypothetical protein [Gammaproteobacteria bacterium]